MTTNKLTNQEKTLLNVAGLLFALVALISLTACGPYTRVEALPQSNPPVVYLPAPIINVEAPPPADNTELEQQIKLLQAQITALANAEHIINVYVNNTNVNNNTAVSNNTVIASPIINNQPSVPSTVENEKERCKRIKEHREACERSLKVRCEEKRKRGGKC